jgi:hypothetical protein
MVPNVAGTGTSFRGAALYYLHDKRMEGEAVRLTTERVAWSETRNLSTDNPELAWRIMAATSLDKDRLKAEAGVKNTGRKSDNTVYAYSIAWHPEEKASLSRAEMVRAANESILALGAQDRQAIIIAHQDEPHPHVHVMINRVSPTDGRMLGTSNDYKKLDAWALAYRQARGEEHKYCPVRVEKAEAMKQAKEGLKVDFVRAQKSVPRSIVGDFAAAKTAANDNEAAKELARQSALSKKLATDGRQQRVRHKLEWTQLSAAYKAKKAQILTASKQAQTRAGDQIKEQYRPAWRELFRRQWKEERAFQDREGRLMGKINNALDAIAHRRELDPENSRGFVSTAFNFLTSRAAREEAFKKRQLLEQRKLTATQRKDFAAAKTQIAGDRRDLLATARKTFGTEREALIVRQDGERHEIRSAWKTRSTESKRAFARVRDEGRVRKDARAEQAASPRTEASNPERFNAASKGESLKTGRGLRRRRQRGSGDKGGDPGA